MFNINFHPLLFFSKTYRILLKFLIHIYTLFNPAISIYSALISLDKGSQFINRNLIYKLNGIFKIVMVHINVVIFLKLEIWNSK